MAIAAQTGFQLVLSPTRAAEGSLGEPAEPDRSPGPSIDINDSSRASFFPIPERNSFRRIRD